MRALKDIRRAAGAERDSHVARARHELEALRRRARRSVRKERKRSRAYKVPYNSVGVGGAGVWGTLSLDSSSSVQRGSQIDLQAYFDTLVQTVREKVVQKVAIKSTSFCCQPNSWGFGGRGSKPSIPLSGRTKPGILSQCFATVIGGYVHVARPLEGEGTAVHSSPLGIT